jgi:hypothetical protein
VRNRTQDLPQHPGERQTSQSSKENHQDFLPVAVEETSPRKSNALVTGRGRVEACGHRWLVRRQGNLRNASLRSDAEPAGVEIGHRKPAWVNTVIAKIAIAWAISASPASLVVSSRLRQ